MNNSQLFFDNLPLFLPLIALNLILMLSAVIHVLKHPNYRFGNRIFWLIFVLMIQFFGPVIYFVFGKGETE
ncbi:PLDc N-terminal domain-containing protein [Enterococcus sp. LJL98]